MSLLDQTPELLQALEGQMTPKFLATRSADGVPNIVPVVSILPAGDRPDTLFFGNFLLRKSNRNLQEEPRVGILVITQDLRGWILRGDFVEFQRTGAYVDRQMNTALLRNKPYTGIRNAGLIRLLSLDSSFRISKLQVAADYAVARLSALGQRERGGGVVLPPPVRREFAKLIAVKVLAWLREDGYPQTAPALSLQPAGAHRLVCRLDPKLALPPEGAAVAANILTFDAVSYQVKGHWSRGRLIGELLAEEAYAGGPPIPGGRVA